MIHDGDLRLLLSQEDKSATLTDWRQNRTMSAHLVWSCLVWMHIAVDVFSNNLSYACGCGGGSIAFAFLPICMPTRHSWWLLRGRRISLPDYLPFVDCAFVRDEARQETWYPPQEKKDLDPKEFFSAIIFVLSQQISILCATYCMPKSSAIYQKNQY